MIPDDIDTGGGSGGGPAKFKAQSTDGRFSIAGNQIMLMSRPSLAPVVPDPFVISLLAIGTGLDGNVNVRGSQGVRITSGPPAVPMVSPDTSSDSTQGIELIASEMQNITLQRGLIDGVDQKIEMTPGNITVDGGVGPVTIQSLTEITFQVAGGVSKITLTPAGIILQGPIIMIN